jgi:hypothetical protein
MGHHHRHLIAECAGIEALRALRLDVVRVLEALTIGKGWPRIRDADLPA